MYKIKNLEKAAERIKKAVQNNERIILYGDSDLDGISSVVILEEAIKSLGGKADSVFFPDRETDGYGINLKALNLLKDKVPALFITLDLGIGNIKEVETANKMGFEIIIVDHHETLDVIPNASIIVDPKHRDDSYPFKGLANVGIAFKLCEEILGDKISKSQRNSFLELAALGTIADMVPAVDENKIIIEEGLRSLKDTFRPAFQAFFDILGKGFVFESGLQKVISALNAAETKDYKNYSYSLLTEASLPECRKMAQNLINESQQKQHKIKEIVEEIERRIMQKSGENIVFEGDPSWKLTLAGAAASIVSQKYEKPVFLFKKMDKESCGSVRNPKDTNSVDAMKTCADFLLSYGGHAQASGFRVRNDNLEKFKQCLSDFFKK